MPAWFWRNDPLMTVAFILLSPAATSRGRPADAPAPTPR
jgi:hypothetical protein